MILPTPTLALKLTVPAAFFGYALIANMALFSAPGARLPDGTGLLNGKVTQEIDGLYRDNLPHKVPSIGLIGAARYLLLDEGRAGVSVGDAGHLFTAEELRPVTGAPYRAALDVIGQAAERLEEAGVQLVMAPVPAKIDLMRSFAPDAGTGVALEILYHRFRADLDTRGIAAVDTRPWLVALDAPFLRTDTHWTPTGARAVAASVAASGIMAPGTDTFIVETDPEVIFAGDLVTYVTSDALAPFVGLAAERATPWRAIVEAPDSGALDLFGDAGGGTDLVGTSYSANPNWSFAEALKLELHRDVINHAEEGRGPFAPMLSYLDRLDPMALPETVIWEIPVRYLTDPDLAVTGAAG